MPLLPLPDRLSQDFLDTRRPPIQLAHDWASCRGTPACVKVFLSTVKVALTKGDDDVEDSFCGRSTDPAGAGPGRSRRLLLGIVTR